MLSLLILGLGVCCLLGGLLLMRYGMRLLFWHRLQRTLSAMTLTPWRGLLIGTIAAVLFQSSTAVCLLTIGLVTAEYMTFRQSVGVILGANIGTCSTVGLLGFVNTGTILPFLLAGAMICLIVRKTRTLGFTCLGLAGMFTGLYLLNRGISVLQEFSIVKDVLLLAKESPWHGIMAGVLITFLFQSSSAATAMLMTLTDAQAFSLASAAYIVYGANLGSCISSVLLSAVAPLAAKRVAAAHVLLNVFGTLLFLPVTPQLVSLIACFSPDPSAQVAELHTLFNLISSLAVLPVAKQFSQTIEFLISGNRANP